MQVETLFQFINEDSIRIDGTRIGIETVIGTYKQGASPEEIILRYPTLSLLQVHATITYYLSNKDEVEAYLSRVESLSDDAWQQQQQNPSSFVRDLRERVEKARLQLAEKDPYWRSR